MTTPTPDQLGEEACRRVNACHNVPELICRWPEDREFYAIKVVTQDLIEFGWTPPAMDAQTLATSKGFTYWPGGKDAPGDWAWSKPVLFRNGPVDWSKPVLFRNGEISSTNYSVIAWTHTGNPGDIIGYHALPVEPALLCWRELIGRPDALEAKYNPYSVRFMQLNAIRFAFEWYEKQQEKQA